MLVEKNVPLQAFNTFHIVAKAHSLIRITSEEDVRAVLADPELAASPKFVLGGGGNIVLTGDVKPVVLKVEIAGKRLVQETARQFIVEAGAGEGQRLGDQVVEEAVEWRAEQPFNPAAKQEIAEVAVEAVAPLFAAHRNGGEVAPGVVGRGKALLPEPFVGRQAAAVSKALIRYRSSSSSNRWAFGPS